MHIKNIIKLTNFKWLNIFEITGIDDKEKERKWQFVSRKDVPLKKESADAVNIVPFIIVNGSVKFVMTKEYRFPIDGIEVGFPAGLIDKNENIEEAIKRELKEETGLDVKRIIYISKPVYSSPGLTDESCIVCVLEAEGEISKKHQEETEDIDIFLLDIEEITEILENKDIKISAKTWGVLSGAQALAHFEGDTRC